MAIAKTLKHNHNILHGGEIIAYTDHKNITYNDTKHVSQCILCQSILNLQGYRAKLEGGMNSGADALSCLPTDKNSLEVAMIELFNTKEKINKQFFPLDLSLLTNAQQNDEQLLQHQPWETWCFGTFNLLQLIMIHSQHGAK